LENGGNIKNMPENDKIKDNKLGSRLDFDIIYGIDEMGKK